MKKFIAGSAIILIITLIVFFMFIAYPSGDKQENEQKALTVSILPLKWIVSKITGNDYRIDVLVPPGASPETYEPTPKQLASLSNADLIFVVGLIDFEIKLMDKIAEYSENKVVNLSRGITLLSGSCGSSANGHDHRGHNHGIDPHIWTSPKQLKIIAENAYRAIARLHPDNKIYEANYRKLITELDQLNLKVANMFDITHVKHFFIYHPAMTYYAEDYNVEQISIEQEGKEPSAERLRSLIDLARRKDITAILYQREFNRSVVETIAKDIGATPFEIDPLAENVAQSIVKITQYITGYRE